MKKSKNYIYEYYQKIEDGSVIVGKWVRLVYEKIIDDLQNKKYYLDLKKANNAVDFIGAFLHHNKGELAPQNVKLELWQKALYSCIFGLVDEDGFRHYSEIVVVVGRKSGKTLMGAGMIEKCVYDDGEYGADTYCLAPKLEQAALVYDAFYDSVQNEPDLDAITKKRKSDLFIAENNTTVKKIAFNAKKSDGFNPYLTICDEFGAWQGDAGLKQYEAMKSGTGARRQPLIFAISTANYINDGIFDELYKRSTRFLMGESKETRLLPFLYQIDDINKWNDITELQKSIPNLGVSVSVNFMLSEIAIAEESLSKKAEFLTKYCNIKQNSSQAWLSAETVKKCCGKHLDIADFKDSYCVAGIDLSQTTDLTACVVCIERDGIINVFSRFYMPEEKIDEATERDQLPYRTYIKRGLLFPSGQNFIDYHDCENWLVELVRDYKIYPLEVGYDRYSAQYLIQDLKNDGFHCDDVLQYFNLSPVLKEMEGLMKDGRINIGDNDLMKIHMLGTAVKEDTDSSKIRMVKLAQNNHIDGVAALSDALCVRQKWASEIGEQLKNEEE